MIVAKEAMLVLILTKVHNKNKVVEICFTNIQIIYRIFISQIKIVIRYEYIPYQQAYRTTYHRFISIPTQVSPHSPIKERHSFLLPVKISVSCAQESGLVAIAGRPDRRNQENREPKSIGRPVATPNGCSQLLEEARLEQILSFDVERMGGRLQCNPKSQEHLAVVHVIYVLFDRERNIL